MLCQYASIWTMEATGRSVLVVFSELWWWGLASLKKLSVQQQNVLQFMPDVSVSASWSNSFDASSGKKEKGK